MSDPITENNLQYLKDIWKDFAKARGGKPDPEIFFCGFTTAAKMVVTAARARAELPFAEAFAEELIRCARVLTRYEIEFGPQTEYGEEQLH